MGLKVVSIVAGSAHSTGKVGAVRVLAEVDIVIDLHGFVNNLIGIWDILLIEIDLTVVAVEI